MVKITLTNKNSNSPYKTAVLDLTARTCLINNEQLIDRNTFKKSEFDHPLLSQMPLHSLTNSYSYRYHDFDSSLLIAHYVYATLIQADDPLNCHFDIAPLPEYNRLKKAYAIPFSPDYRKQAQHKITVDQFNNIVRELHREFHFCDQLITETELSYHDLPDEIDGDALFEDNAELRRLLSQPEDFERYEIRYINQFIGCGVYARKNIKKDEMIVVYYGKKTMVSDLVGYNFIRFSDILNLEVDAVTHGNTARFINHAPDPQKTPQPGPILEANLFFKRTRIYGLEVVVYYAMRDISKGEQLLIDYGTQYFKEISCMRFRANGNSLDTNNKELQEYSERKMFLLRLFARNGIKDSIIKLAIKSVLAIFLLTLFVYFLMHFDPSL